MNVILKSLSAFVCSFLSRLQLFLSVFNTAGITPVNFFKTLGLGSAAVPVWPLNNSSWLQVKLGYPVGVI